MKEILPNAKIKTELIDVAKIKIPERKLVYYLLKPESRYDKNVIGAYVIQGPKKEMFTADLKIAEQLDLRQASSEL